LPRSSAQLDRVVVKFNTGKSHGIKNVSTEQCVIAPAGMNERGSLKKVLGGRANDAGLEDSRLTGQKCLPSTPARSRSIRSGNFRAPRVPTCYSHTRKSDTTKSFRATCPI